MPRCRRRWHPLTAPASPSRTQPISIERVFVAGRARWSEGNQPDRVTGLALWRQANAGRDADRRDRDPVRERSEAGNRTVCDTPIATSAHSGNAAEYPMPISSALHHGRPGLNGPGQPQTFNNRHPVTDLPRDLGPIIGHTPYGLVFNGSDRRVPTGNSGIVARMTARHRPLLLCVTMAARSSAESKPRRTRPLIFSLEISTTRQR